MLSIGALGALAAAGLRVPQDVGILGLNDMKMAGWERIALTTIRQPLDRITATAVDLIEAVIAEPDRLSEARIFACRLVERATLRAGPG